MVTSGIGVVPEDMGFDALAADGGVVRIRPVRDADGTGLAALHERASDTNLYRRFMAAGRGDVAAEVARLTRPAGPDHMAVLAEEGGRVVGVASYERLRDPARAEFALFVDDSQHGRGIGTLLLEHLAVAARRSGIAELIGEILASNAPMLTVATDLAPGIRLVRDRDVVQVSVPTADLSTSALEERDREAERHSLAPLLAPHAVAVVGAGRDPGGIGHRVLAQLRDAGFTGHLYAVNPHARRIAGVDCYPTVGAVPDRVDLALLAVPAHAVAGVLADCGRSGVRAAVVLTSGFGESGDEGRAAQAELVRIGRTHGIRLVGPNCLGLLNTDPAVRLSATLAAVSPPAGALGVASQSGAIAITILDHAARAGVGVSTFVSLGNKADVSGNDLLSYWYDDPATRAVVLYLESVGNPRRFARIARAVARRKPVLVVKGRRGRPAGASSREDQDHHPLTPLRVPEPLPGEAWVAGRAPAGDRPAGGPESFAAPVSHAAAAADPDARVDALCAQAGVIRCDGLGELLDTARLLISQPLPGGNRIAILGNASGVNVLAADAAGPRGLAVPDMVHGVANPVDLGAKLTPSRMRAAIRGAVCGGDADAILVVFAATLANDVPAVVAAIGEALDTVPVPAAAVLLGVPNAPNVLGRQQAPVYALPEQAIAALGHAVRYAAWRATPLGSRPELSDVDASGARELVARALAALPPARDPSPRRVWVRGAPAGRPEPPGGWQPPDVGAELLRRYGLPVLACRVVHDAAAAVAAAGECGYPVVLKAADPRLVHRSEVGGVRLALADADAVRRAYREVTAAVGGTAVLVQPQVSGQVELVAGVLHDPLFGSLVMLGLGGVRADLFADRALRLLPVTDLDAGRMWRSLRAAPLLTGYRGEPGVDTAAVEDLVSRLGRLAEDLPEVAELDLNPVLAGPDGLQIVDVKVRLARVGREPDAVLRALREP